MEICGEGRGCGEDRLRVNLGQEEDKREDRQKAERHGRRIQFSLPRFVRMMRGNHVYGRLRASHKSILESCHPSVTGGFAPEPHACAQVCEYFSSRMK